MADPARELFDELVGGGHVRIQQLVTDQEPESSILDFKSNTDEKGNSSGTLKGTGKKVLAKALSAFSNAGGGTLVWGIEDSGDKAFNTKPVPNVANFVVQLNKQTPEVVYPPLDGVIHKAIPDPHGQGEGFVVTYIPDGKFKPHMSRATDQWTYFLRSGESSLPMPDPAVRAFVTAGSHPSLSVKIVLKEIAVTEEPFQGTTRKVIPILRAIFGVSLVNDGQVIAEKCAVTVGTVHRVFMTGWGITLHEDGQPVSATIFRGSFMKTMYPGMEIEVTDLTLTTHDFVRLGGIAKVQTPLTFRYWIHAVNFSGSGETTFTESQLNAPYVPENRRGF